MIYSAQVTVNEDIKNIQQLFQSEEKEFSNARAKYEIIKGKGDITFKFTAEDATALRAVLNSVAKMLATYEKTKNAIK